MARLGELCRIQSGGTPSRSNKTYWENGTIPWVKISDIRSKYLSNTDEFITNTGLENSSAKLFPSGTILYTIFATLGEVCILNIDATTNQAIVGIQIESDKIESNYLYYYLLSLKPTVNNIGRGVAQNNINMKILKEFEVPLRPLDEQRKIAAVLDKVSDLIAKHRQQLDKLDLLVKSQFIVMFQNKGYDVVNAGTVMKNMRNGLSPSTSGTCHGKVLTLTAFTQGAFDDTQWKDATFAETPPESKRISASDFYMCRGNGNVKLVGRGVYANQSNENLVFPDTVIAASIDTENICLPYLFMAWQMPDVRDQIEKGARTTNGTYKINQKILSDITLILPPLPEQLKFAEVLQQTDKSKSTIQQSLEKLETLKKALMQEYFG